MNPAGAKGVTTKAGQRRFFRVAFRTVSSIQDFIVRDRASHCARPRLRWGARDAHPGSLAPGSEGGRAECMTMHDNARSGRAFVGPVCENVREGPISAESDEPRALADAHGSSGVRQLVAVGGSRGGVAEVEMTKQTQSKPPKSARKPPPQRWNAVFAPTAQCAGDGTKPTRDATRMP